MSLLQGRRTRGILVASAAVAAAGAIAAPAADAYTSVSIHDGVARGDYGGNSVSAWSTDAASRLEIVRGGAVVASTDAWGYSDFDVAAGDVVRVLDANTGALLTQVTYSGKPAVVACAGSANFTLATDDGETHVAAYPDDTVERYSPADFGYLRGEVTATAAGTFTGSWGAALPAASVVNATTYSSTGTGNDQVVVYTSVERRAADLCPKPVQTATPATPPATKPVVTPVLPKPAVTPKQLAKQLLESTIETLAEGGVAGVTKPQNVPVTVTGPGTVQIQQFSGAAPKKVTVYAAAAKKKAKKAALPKNLLASGKRTFTKAGAGTVKVTPTKRAKAVAKGKKRLTVTVRVVFQPKGGKPVAQDSKVTLKRGK